MHNNNVRLDLIENMLNDEIDSDNEEDYGQQQTQRETKEIEIDETAAEKKLRYFFFAF